MYNYLSKNLSWNGNKYKGLQRKTPLDVFANRDDINATHILNILKYISNTSWTQLEKNAKYQTIKPIF